ncbi:SWI/SNF-related matrix-associated actin-dependent regulator of chromatin subfamily A containing DEAD/H box 1 homolog [Nilaparvata lugens]|uniref:SWI/SNF-related matrix-associated actin-dependent regulator of chromatin subfamily A containing DEAD/H box 1 homolog n=1 Tax=Nilaparvata lugens TaxID=108931 RepID=UPI00193D575B|nr:SWI/SNF-related matrix-associated actin-dependent regulator of chromatin subfamily A containing DEAD/H box 1 homolog [Nilaparvata lugens]XP_039286229.1 SWI/SNF-related matrix-associated actin-dependent regulator of chromatin subfamily A containing DEAD/H box 1 homolog [Nilaparvata lugens]
MSQSPDDSESPSLLNSLKRYRAIFLKESTDSPSEKVKDNKEVISESSDSEHDESVVAVRKKKTNMANGHHALSTSESDDEYIPTGPKKRRLQDEEQTQNEPKKSKFNHSNGSITRSKTQSNLLRFLRKSNDNEVGNNEEDDQGNTSSKAQLLNTIRANFNKAIDAGSKDQNKHTISPRRFYPEKSSLAATPKPLMKKMELPASIQKVSKKKQKKKKIQSDDDDDGDEDAMINERVYNSDSDSDQESAAVTGVKAEVLDFLNTATEEEISEIKYRLSKVKALFALRPFNDWQHLVEICESNKDIGTGILNATQELISARNVLSNLMSRCEVISERTKRAVEMVATNIKTQPSILNPEMQLKSYQMVGLNWLAVMHNRRLNGILADEMGLGKTIQVIAFLAYLKEQNLTRPNTPHLIVVPSSTLDNWINEFGKWCPDMIVCQYYGSVDERRSIRLQWLKHGVEGIDVILATYAIVAGSFDDRKLFRLLKLHYVIFDEGHLLKNMNSQRFDVLFRINAESKLLLTGTPIQNSLLELMSLLVFVMPKMFGKKLSCIKFIFDKRDKAIVDKLKFDKENIAKAKKVMMPFILRRLKADVLQDLPTKTSCVIECAMLESQEKQYKEFLLDAKENAAKEESFCNMSVMMQLRRLANHPLCMRYIISDDEIEQIAKLLARNPDYKDKNLEKITDDLLWMSDHEVHQLVKKYHCPKKYLLPDSLFPQSGKFAKLDQLLPDLKANNHRVLIFSQFCFMLDLYEKYLELRQHSYLRIDGATAVMDRQQLIDEFNDDPSIFVFLLTTKSGGMGINLTSADTVIINDVDFNPYNDKQAEDRVHRMGQKREVKIIRLISKGTIEEIIYKVAQEKSILGKDLTNDEEYDGEDKKTILNILRSALDV